LIFVFLTSFSFVFSHSEFDGDQSELHQRGPNGGRENRRGIHSLHDLHVQGKKKSQFESFVLLPSYCWLRFGWSHFFGPWAAAVVAAWGNIRKRKKLTDDKIIRGVRLIPPGWINAEQLLLLLLPLGGSRLLVGVFVGFSVVVWRSWLWPLLSPAAPCVCQSKSHASSSSSFLILFLGKFYNLVVVVCGCCSGMLSLNGRNASWLVFSESRGLSRGGGEMRLDEYDLK
jgi:hypothetical protein